MGKISKNRVLKGDAPNASEAAAYSFSFSTRTVDLTILVNPGIETMLTAKTAFLIPGPRRVTTTIARSMLGKDIMISITLMITRSIFPPKYPDIRPRNVPNESDRITTKNPIKIETRDP